jgi:hypothetical protein
MTAKVGKIPRDDLGSTPCRCIKAMARDEGFDPKRSLVREKKQGTSSIRRFSAKIVSKTSMTSVACATSSLRATEQGINSRQQGINFAIAGNEQAMGAKSIRSP